jgi:hypothetical protein
MQLDDDMHNQHELYDAALSQGADQDEDAAAYQAEEQQEQQQREQLFDQLLSNVEEHIRQQIEQGVADIDEQDVPQVARMLADAIFNGGCTFSSGSLSEYMAGQRGGGYSSSDISERSLTVVHLGHAQQSCSSMTAVRQTCRCNHKAWLNYLLADVAPEEELNDPEEDMMEWLRETLGVPLEEEDDIDDEDPDLQGLDDDTKQTYQLLMRNLHTKIYPGSPITVLEVRW